MIKIKQLVKRFYGKNVFLDYSAKFTHPRLCVSGVNGQGKTTLFCILAGVEPAQSGTISINEVTFTQFDALSKVVSLASDKIPYPEFLTALQIIQLQHKSWQKPYPEQLIEQFNFSSMLNTQFQDLSSGNQKKLQLICAFLRETDILLLDEPTSALEHRSIPVLLALIEQYQGQVLITCHEPEVFIANGFQVQALANDV